MSKHRAVGSDSVPWRCSFRSRVVGSMAEALANAPLSFALCARAVAHNGLPPFDCATKDPLMPRWSLHVLSILVCAVILFATMCVYLIPDPAHAQLASTLPYNIFLRPSSSHSQAMPASCSDQHYLDCEQACILALAKDQVSNNQETQRNAWPSSRRCLDRCAVTYGCSR